MFKKALKIALFAQSLLLSTSVLATTYNFIGVNANEVNVSNQLLLDVTQIGNSADFKFINALGGVNVFVGAIYFDFLNANLFTSLNQTASLGTVSFTGITPSTQNFPEGNLIDFSTNAEADRNGRAGNGINIGEHLILTALLSPGADINSLMQAGGLRVGLHVQGYRSGGSDSYVTTPNAVPLPAAGWLFGSALLGFIGLSRRQL